MQTGTVKFYNEAKGFGFIKADDAAKEYFVHSSELKEQVRENDKVQFEVGEGKKGPMAVNVTLIK